jgi:hypothetical protein
MMPGGEGDSKRGRKLRHLTFIKKYVIILKKDIFQEQKT